MCLFVCMVVKGGREGVESLLFLKCLIAVFKMLPSSFWWKNVLRRKIGVTSVLVELQLCERECLLSSH